jgi:hypothetical protein
MPFFIHGKAHIKVMKLLLTKYLLNIGCSIRIHNFYNPTPPRLYGERLHACAGKLQFRREIEITYTFRSKISFKISNLMDIIFKISATENL